MPLKDRKNQRSPGAGFFVNHMLVIQDDCQWAMKVLKRPDKLSNATLAECARLCDSLEVTNRFLRSAVAQAAISRRKSDHSKTN